MRTSLSDEIPPILKDAQWIWPESHHWDLHNSYAQFRKKFQLRRIPPTAPLFITADQSYQLYINGEYICRGPARGFQSHWPYDEVDVHRYLRKGDNVLAVRAYNPGFSNFQYLTQGYAGLLVSAKWGSTRIISDKTWKCRRQTGLHRDTMPTSVQLFCQEHIDLRLEDPGWMGTDYDDGNWNAEIATAVWNSMPWSRLEARGIPMLEEKMSVPSRLIGVAAGRCGKGYLPTRDITRVRFTEGLAHRACDLDAGEILVESTGRGRFRSFLIDFGRTVVGSVGFEIQGAGGGEILDTLHVETIEAKTLTPHFTPDRPCRMAFGHRLICREGIQSHTFYHTFGFRYMVLTVRDSTSTLTIRPHLRSTLYPLVQNGGFRSSDATLNRIWEACSWTQRVCSLDAYVDTPWREQAQWWGDARVQAKNTFFLSGDTRLFRRGIAQIAAQTTPDGLTYGHAPTIAHSCILPDFTLIWLITLWDYYWQTGSLEPLLEQEQTIRAALKYFEEITDEKTGLIGYDKRFWLFLDWTGLFKDGYSTVYNLWLLIALEKLASMFEKAGRQSEARGLSAWAGRLRKSLALLVRKDGILFDGLTFSRKIVKSTSVHAQTLAILAGFCPELDTGRMSKVILPFIRRQTQPEIVPSSYWITYVFEVLTAAGHGADVVDFIREKWGPMAEHGTTWENFAPRVGDESFSHAWSAHPLYHLMQIIGGIRQRTAGWKSIVFQPSFIGGRADVTVPTPFGNIRSDWKREGRIIHANLSLPEGVSAEVRLPGLKTKKVQGCSSWSLDA
ncbi:MAG: alpha-L-rhamnosidase C-terminal domain-containing protein [Verrucomicrobiota bacterium]